MRGREKIKVIFRPLLTIMTIFTLFILPFSSFGADNQIRIEQTPSTTFPIIIDQPGNYVLMSDLMVSTSHTHGLLINADEVILDLNDHIIQGPGQECGPEDTGISASNKKNITILNGVIQGFSYGLSLSGNNHEIKKVRAAHNSFHGFQIESSTLTDCLAEYNGSYGIRATSCTIINCSARDNTSFGLEADSCTVTKYTAINNHSHGLYTTGKCLIEECDLRENDGYGLYLCPDYSYAVKNKTTQNTLGSFYIDGSHYLPTSGDDANYEL